MRGWPAEADGSPPSPRLVAAWRVLDVLAAEDVPGWAAQWLACGHAGPALVELASMHGDDPREVGDVLEAALAECGVAPRRGGDQGLVDAATVVFRALARLGVEGRVSARWLAARAFEIASPHFPKEITNLPMGSLFSLEDEWRDGWGGSERELRDVVHAACRAQLRTTMM